MIDINSFKYINDIFGHDNGDKALEYVAAILRKTFGKNDFIARYGGDEFIVIMEITDIKYLNEAIVRLKENVDIFNEQKITPYYISLSLGYDIYDRNKFNNSDEFVRHIDKLMYEDKHRYFIKDFIKNQS